MVNLNSADHNYESLDNIYHRYIKLPFEFVEPDWKDVRRTFSEEQKKGSEYYDIKEKGDTDVYFCHTPENDKKVTEFLDMFNLFYDSKLVFYTKANEEIKVHIDNNKEEIYSKKVDNFIDNHAKLNITWEPNGGKLRWWDLKNDKDLKIDTHTTPLGKTWNVIWANQNECDMVYEKEINKPSIVNTGRPHSTFNPSKEGRLTLSYNLVKKNNLELVSFFEALWLFVDLLSE